MRKPIVPKRIEAEYSRKLRKVAMVVGTIIQHHTIITKDDKGSIVNVLLREGLNVALINYAQSIDGWAKSVAKEMISHTDRSNARYWNTIAPVMSKELKSVQAESAIGAVAKRIQDEQVLLIKSIPIEAGERAQSLAREAIAGGRRMDETAKMIMDSEGIARSRANTIARTEIHKAWSALTQSRAEYVGANQYIWRTAGDEIVRDSHMEMDGEVCDFNSPPTLSDGETANAGEFVNCRCYAEPIIR